MKSMIPTTAKLAALAIATPVLFVACDNPAANTTTAVVADAVEAPASTEADGGTRYAFTPESEVKFVGSKVTRSHDGGFKNVTGHFTVQDGKLVGNDHEVVIDINSIWSDDEKLTAHLKSADFFDVESYPTATFAATSIEQTSETEYTVSGNFTLHGVTKNLTFPATAVEEGETVRIQSKFDINRKDFGIVYAGMADDLIRDEVVIELDLKVEPEA